VSHLLRTDIANKNKKKKNHKANKIHTPTKTKKQKKTRQTNKTHSPTKKKRTDKRAARLKANPALASYPEQKNK